MNRGTAKVQKEKGGKLTSGTTKLTAIFSQEEKD